MLYCFLTKEQIAKDEIYHYSGLDTSKFLDICYNEEATQAVVKTTQKNIPAGIQEITEAEFGQYAAQWPQPTQPESVQQLSRITLEELNEKVDLLIMMQLENAGVI